MQEPRFPDTRLPDDADDLPVALLRPQAGLTKSREFGSPTDKARPRDGRRLPSQHHPRRAPGVAQPFEHEPSSHKWDNRLRDDDRPRAVDRHQGLEDGPRRGFAVHCDVERRAVSAHDVVIAIDRDHNVRAAARRRVGARRRGVDRQGREGGVARRVVDRLESKDRHEAGRARLFNAPAEDADLLRDHSQGARDIDGR